jgi:hypothetical protein
MELEEKPKTDLSAFYLTLVSIIQSLAFTYLLGRLETLLSNPATRTANTGLQAIMAFLAIVLVWHQYAMGAIFFKWTLDIWDSVIPFLLGAAEYFMIATMAKAYSLWLWSLPPFIFLAALAYWNQYRKAVVQGQTEASIQLLSRRSAKFTLFYFVSFLALAFFFPVRQMPVCSYWILSLIICVMFVVETYRINRGYASALRRRSA